MWGVKALRARWSAAYEPADELLLASVENELTELKHQVGRVSLEKPRAPRELPAVEPGLFEAKLRHPGVRRQPEWWAVLGLNQ